MGKDKYDDVAEPSGEHSAEAGIEFEAANPQDAKEQGDEMLAEFGSDNTVGEVINERTGEETRFD